MAVNYVRQVGSLPRAMRLLKEAAIQQFKQGNYGESERTLKLLAEFVPPKTHDHQWIIDMRVSAKEQIAAELFKQGRYKAEAETWRSIIEYQTEHHVAHFHYGERCVHALNMVRTGIGHLKFALELKPNSKVYAKALEKAKEKFRKQKKVQYILNLSKK